MAETRRFIGELLVELRRVDQSVVDEALEKQVDGDERRLGEILVANGVCKDLDVTAALAEQFGIEMVDPSHVELTDGTKKLLTVALCREHTVFPIDVYNGVLTLAIDDPFEAQRLDKLRFALQIQIEPVLATKAAIVAAIDRCFVE